MDARDIILGHFVACDLAMSYNHRMRQFGLPLFLDPGTKANPKSRKVVFDLTCGDLVKAGWFDTPHNKLAFKIRLRDPNQKLRLQFYPTARVGSCQDPDFLEGETMGYMFLLTKAE